MSREEAYKVLRSLFEAKELVETSGQIPEDMYHPKYGWLIQNGEVTETCLEFFGTQVKPKKTK